MHRETRSILPFETAENFRQLGGLPAAGGKTVKPGLFWRCGALCELKSEQDRRLFDSLGIRVICDLRSSTERAAQPDPEFDGVRRHDISAILDENGNEINFDPRSFLEMTDQEILDLWHDLQTYYENMPFGNTAYRTMFREIRQGNLPLLFHCSAGKDRTGIAAALILLALGADRKTVEENFLLTNQCRPRAVKDYTESYAPKIARNPRLADCMQAMSGVELSNLDRALDAIDARYPDIRDYFEQELGLTAEDIAAIRAACLE